MRRETRAAPGGKMTVFVLQMEGDDSTLQEGFRSISTALNGILAHRLPTRVVAASASPALLPTEDNEHALDSEPVVDSIENKSNGAQAARRRLRSPQVLDLDLTAGDMPLKRFLEPHESVGVKKQYLLAAYWLKTYRSLADVTADHIHTCFKHMQWATPRSASQPLRDMKSRDQWFHKGEGRGTYTLNHVGENIVQELLKGIEG